MDYHALKTLIDTHPDLAGTTDQAVSDWCNAEVIDRDKATLPSTEILETILTYKTEWDALTADDKATVRDVMYIASGEGVPTAPGNPIRALLVSILGTQTKQALAAKIGYKVSRATDAGILKTVSADHVAYARTL